MATTVTDRAQGIILAEALKSPVRVATTANITLSGLQTIDGVVLSANDRVLVKSQTDAVENGIYVAASSAWTRSSDFNGIYDVVQGTRVYIAAGTLYAGYEATITTENPITIGTSEITFALLLVVDAGLFADIETVADNIADINTCADNIAAIIAAPAEAADAAASADDAEYWAGIAAGGGITSITAGTGIIVDDTDPAAPEVSVDVGTAANKIVQLDGDAKLPAIDGSQLTNLPASANVGSFVNNFRLTGLSNTPIDLGTGTYSTLYLTPYNGNKISLYSGTEWETVTSAQVSKVLTGLTGSTVYDVFCYNNAGTPTLEFLAWASSTARATALTTQDGVLVKTGAATRLYLGTFYAASATTFYWTETQRDLWNYYNKVPILLRIMGTTASYTYTTATWRSANGSYNVRYVCGVSDALVSVQINATYANTAVNFAMVAVGVGSTTSPSGIYGSCASQQAGLSNCVTGEYTGPMQIGSCTLTWLEISVAAGTTTWYGNINPGSGVPAVIASGMHGTIMG